MDTTELAWAVVLIVGLYGGLCASLGFHFGSRAAKEADWEYSCKRGPGGVDERGY